MFSENDQTLLAAKGIPESTIKEQIAFFQKGFPYLELIGAAEVDSGIMRMSEDTVEKFVKFFQGNLDDEKVVKFVPASGAASRMFKDFFGLMQDPHNPKQYPQAQQALQRIKDFAFYKPLSAKMAQDGIDMAQAITSGHYTTVLEYILTEKGLNYGFLPKGLLAFHRYGDISRVPMEEHLVEAANYGRDAADVARVHFTVSPQHRSHFDALEQAITSSYEKAFGVKYQISYSEQKPSTDTLAVDLDNQPFRQEDGTMLFRPGGHGALLENLNDISGGLIFIKNIDNVVPDYLKGQTYRYKMALAGLLLSVRKEIFQLLALLEKDPSAADQAKAAVYLKEKLNVLPSGDSSERDIDYLYGKLNRPLRVCGMVINEGEPGGGPFWVRSTDGTTSLQIVETIQVDPGNPSQQEIVGKSTHFNPVDLVCSTRDHQGNKFDLRKFRDPNTGFISRKSQGGRELKALELPGLWNGAMAHWNTLFVEVPAITFNPVKTVNDLLRKEHQPQK